MFENASKTALAQLSRNKVSLSKDDVLFMMMCSRKSERRRLIQLRVELTMCRPYYQTLESRIINSAKTSDNDNRQADRGRCSPRKATELSGKRGNTEI